MIKVKKILVIGSGGREHAICKAFFKSPQQPIIYALPGNGGTQNYAQNIDHIAINQHEEILKFCHSQQIDLVFIGPEQPLVEGLSDFLRSKNIKVFGPSQKAAQLEASKVFMKQITDQFNIPTAKYSTFSDADLAIAYSAKIGFPCVIKADGLAQGKGVIIAHDQIEATAAINEILHGKFGDAGKKIIIEEFLKGFEASYFVICDGKNFLPLGFAHDHKKVGDGETGLNTGGMGTYYPSPFINDALENKIIETIIKPTLEGMNHHQANFCGILFAGLMIDGNEAKLLEFNVRFGDPETQVILANLKSDLVTLIEKAIDGQLQNHHIEFDDKKTVCVVICSNGYPNSYKKNVEITQLKNIEDLLRHHQSINGELIENVDILHAGTTEKDGKYYATGGRVLNIVASAPTFQQARQKAYKIVEAIDWKAGFYRRDIALSAIKEKL